MNWSPFQYHAYEARRMPNKAAKEGVASERALHAAILNECARRDWIPIHSRMDLPSTLDEGTADFIILADGGATIIAEGKSKTGKLTTAQLGFIMRAKKLDHTVHVVRSIEQFMQLCEHGRGK